jgi:hypothetical protein
MRMLAAIVVGIVLSASPALAQAPKPTSYTLLDTVSDSLFGDVYAEPSKWQTLSAGTFRPKAQSLNDELDKPQLDTARLP